MSQMEQLEVPQASLSAEISNGVVRIMRDYDNHVDPDMAVELFVLEPLAELPPD